MARKLTVVKIVAVESFKIHQLNKFGRHQKVRQGSSKRSMNLYRGDDHTVEIFGVGRPANGPLADLQDAWLSGVP